MSAAMVLDRAMGRSPEGRCADRDADLLDALRRGDATAADLLVARYGERAYRLASRITGNGHDAEEVVQDAFWSVVRKIETFRGESAFGSWLYRIVANAAYQRLRAGQSGRQELPFDEGGRRGDAAVDWTPRAADPAVQAELRTELGAAIDALPAAYRAPLVLRDVEASLSVWAKSLE